MGCFALGNALITGIGRAGFHPVQAITSRYTTISYPFWISIKLLCAVSFHVLKTDLRDRKRPVAWLKFPKVIFFGFIFYYVSLNSLRSIQFLELRQQALQKVSNELFILKDEALLKEMYPDSKFLKIGVEILKKRKLSVFREGSV